MSYHGSLGRSDSGGVSSLSSWRHSQSSSRNLLSSVNSVSILSDADSNTSLSQLNAHLKGDTQSRHDQNAENTKAKLELAADLRRREKAVKKVLSERTVVQELTRELRKWRQHQTLGMLKHNGDDLSDPWLDDIQSDETFRSAVHKFFTIVTRSSLFDQMIMTCIFINAIFIAVESSIEEKTAYKYNIGELFTIVDLMFVTIYSCEFMLKIYCEPCDYWKNSYNRFDFFVLVMSFPQYFSSGSDLQFVRVLRALRALRALRSISFIRALRVLVNALLKTLTSIANLLSLLLLLMYIFAIVGFYFFGQTQSQLEEDREWSSLDKCMMNLWVYVTADGWAEFQYHLDDRGMKIARIYTVLFIFIGVIIQNLNEAQDEEKLYQYARRHALVAAKRNYLRRVQWSDMTRHTKKSTVVDSEQIEEGEKRNFQAETKTLRTKVRRDDLVPMVSLTCDLVWLRTYMASLGHQEQTAYHLQQLHFDMANTLAKVIRV